MDTSNIRVVLVGTTHPGNIGATARAMKTMGINRLLLAAPRCQLTDEATAMAASATDILTSAITATSLREAVADCSLVVATSARPRNVQWPQADVRACAKRIAAGPRTEQVALVFGRERSGLTNVELDCCNLLVRIPTAEDFPSLNLAAAVQILCYELFRELSADRDADANIPTGADACATSTQMEGLFRHLEQTLLRNGFLLPERNGVALRRLRSLVHRAAPSSREVQILRGILTAQDRVIDRVQSKLKE